jgi:hypothetical protein
MTYVGWFLFGTLISMLNFASINRTVNRLVMKKSARQFWLHYLARLIFTGSALMLALHNDVSYMIFVFVGLIIFRWTFVLPGCRRFYFTIVNFARG